ncbi:MAG: hypothetical protein LN413_05640 [Candidatus Thermoplasmatota archaeon]|nr:hypothetical protein [Candidatus Thermoplasmatota archaeon]
MAQIVRGQHKDCRAEGGRIGNTGAPEEAIEDKPPLMMGRRECRGSNRLHESDSAFGPEQEAAQEPEEEAGDGYGENEGEEDDH